MGILDFPTIKQGHCCKSTTPILFLSSLRDVCRSHSPTILSLPPSSHLRPHRRPPHHRPPPPSSSTVTTINPLFFIYVRTLSLFFYIILLAATNVLTAVQPWPSSFSELDLRPPSTSSSPSRRRRSVQMLPEIHSPEIYLSQMKRERYAW